MNAVQIKRRGTSSVTHQRRGTGLRELVRTYLFEWPAAQSLAPDSGLLMLPAELLTFETFEAPATLWAAIQKAGSLQQAIRHQSTPLPGDVRPSTVAEPHPQGSG